MRRDPLARREREAIAQRPAGLVAPNHDPCLPRYGFDGQVSRKAGGDPREGVPRPVLRYGEMRMYLRVPPVVGQDAERLDQAVCQVDNGAAGSGVR